MLNKTHAEKVPHATFGIHKKQSFVRSSDSNSSRIRAHTKQNARRKSAARTPKKCFTWPLESIKNTIFCPQFRNTRTAAGFEHMRSTTHTIFCPQSRNTRTAAGFEHMLSKTHAEKVPHVTFGIHKKQSFVRSSETLEQQQDSCTYEAKRTPKKCLTWPLESIKNNLLSAVPKHSNSSRIRAHAKQNARRKSASRDLWNP